MFARKIQLRSTRERALQVAVKFGKFSSSSQVSPNLPQDLADGWLRPSFMKFPALAVLVSGATHQARSLLTARSEGTAKYDADKYAADVRANAIGSVKGTKDSIDRQLEKIKKDFGVSQAGFTEQLARQIKSQTEVMFKHIFEYDQLHHYSVPTVKAGMASFVEGVDAALALRKEVQKAAAGGDGAPLCLF